MSPGELPFGGVPVMLRRDLLGDDLDPLAVICAAPRHLPCPAENAGGGRISIQAGEV